MLDCEWVVKFRPVEKGIKHTISEGEGGELGIPEREKNNEGREGGVGEFLPDSRGCSGAIKPEIERLRITPPQQFLAEGHLHKNFPLPMDIIMQTETETRTVA